MKLKFQIPLLAFIILFGWSAIVYAHCEIPCGIYDDKMRIEMIREHIITIEKSMNQIVELSKENQTNYNQLIRWINNKEDHANQLQHIVAQYFLTQRIKPVDEKDVNAQNDYVTKLSLLHQMLIYSMKSKQTVDQKNIQELRSIVDKFYDAYFDEEAKSHIKEHH
jgi:nickel superoxide dismutase